MHRHSCAQTHTYAQTYIGTHTYAQTHIGTGTHSNGHTMEGRFRYLQADTHIQAPESEEKALNSHFRAVFIQTHTKLAF